MDGYARTIERISKLTAEPSDLVTLWRESTEILKSAVPHFWTPCWFSMDPASLLITSHYHDGLPEFPPAWLAEEYYGNDVHKLVDIATSETGISTLYEATGGNPSSSAKWHTNMSMGGDQELLLRLRTRGGEVWGMLGLYRAPGSPTFDSREKNLLSTVAPRLAEAARRALLLGEAADPEWSDAPGVLIIDHKWDLVSATPNAGHWLEELPDGNTAAGRLPSAVQSVAARALTSAEQPAEQRQVAMARVRSRSGRWLILHGARIQPGSHPLATLIIEPAHPSTIAPLLLSAYGLTEREGEITQLVIKCFSTAQIAQALFISPYTVQQHLKSVFDKVGVSSRRDLLGRLFYAHYEPRFRDNERRTLRSLPLRGGPTAQQHFAGS
ncbi:hypothetical protein BJG92_03521 [Arthrobacter sp. SO5]|nr:hypothetical protein [Arthrobacter sp. SO5]